MYVCIGIGIHICKYISTMYIGVCNHTFINKQCIHMHIYIYICIIMYTHICIQCICIYTMYIYIYICIHRYANIRMNIYMYTMYTL